MNILLNEVFNEPILLAGPSGSGKTYCIEDLARRRRLTLYSYNCRKDKTLREGRNKLISWVFLKEPCIVWLEGADDLTIEAQSFLRRSLETYSRSVLLILEVRDTAFIADPLRSRCKTIIVPRPTADQCVRFLIDKHELEETDAELLVSKVRPLNYRALEVYVNANKLLTIKEECIYDKDNSSIINAINEGTATGTDILEWKKNGAYVTDIVSEAMRECSIKWYPDMPVGARGRNPWFHLGYIVALRRGQREQGQGQREQVQTGAVAALK